MFSEFRIWPQYLSECLQKYTSSMIYFFIFEKCGRWKLRWDPARLRQFQTTCGTWRVHPRFPWAWTSSKSRGWPIRWRGERKDGLIPCGRRVFYFLVPVRLLFFLPPWSRDRSTNAPWLVKGEGLLELFTVPTELGQEFPLPPSEILVSWRKGWGTRDAKTWRGGRKEWRMNGREEEEWYDLPHQPWNNGEGQGARVV